MKTYGKRFELIKRALFPEEKHMTLISYTAIFWVTYDATTTWDTLPLPSNLAIYKTSSQNVDLMF